MTVVADALILSRAELSRDCFRLGLSAPEIARASRAGQFVMVSDAGELELPSPLLRRALAVYSREPEGHEADAIHLLIKIVGEGTRKLAHLKAGDKVSMVGPLGNGFDLSRAAGKVNLVVAGGSGIASVYLLTRELNARDEEVHLFYGGRSGDDLVGLEDFEQLGIPIVLTTEDGSRGLKGLVTDGLVAHLDSPGRQSLNLYTCGPNPMMKAVCRLAADRRIPCQISVESKMACGFGVCLGCSVKTTRGLQLACTDGPVFAADEFIWEPDLQGPADSEKKNPP